MGEPRRHCQSELGFLNWHLSEELATRQYEVLGELGSADGQDTRTDRVPDIPHKSIHVLAEEVGYFVSGNHLQQREYQIHMIHNPGQSGILTQSINIILEYPIPLPQILKQGQVQLVRLHSIPDIPIYPTIPTIDQLSGSRHNIRWRSSLHLILP